MLLPRSSLAPAGRTRHRRLTVLALLGLAMMVAGCSVVGATADVAGTAVSATAEVAKKTVDVVTSPLP